MDKSHAAKLDLGTKPKPSVFCLLVKLISSAPQNCSRNEVFPGQLGAQAHICLQNPRMAIPLLHLSSQLWFTPSLSFFCPLSQDPAMSAPAARLRDRTGSQRWPTCSLPAHRRVFLQEAGGWPVQEALGERTEWQLFPIWKRKGCDLSPCKPLVRTRGTFSLFVFQVETPPRVHAGSERSLC